MIKLYFFILLIGVVVFLILFKLSFVKRLIVSLSIVVLLSVGSTMIIIWSGDKPLEGARTITKEELDAEGDYTPQEANRPNMTNTK